MQQETETPTKAHITLKAITTVGTDEGVFEAVISTESVDREKDVVDAEAMVKALRAWIEVGKLLPLAWQHSPKAEDQIGHIDPASVKAATGEVIASGWIDQSTERGAHAWRLVKSGTLGFSFGYLTLAATKRTGGGHHITELDVFEVSATPTPMNHDTRVLTYKSTEELREEAKRVEREIEEAKLPDVPERKRLASDIRSQLDAAGLERFGKGDGKWAYVDDWDPDAKWAVFEVSTDSDRRFVQVGYTLDSAGEVTLGTDETEVVRTTTYQAAGEGKTFTTSELQEVKARLAQTEQALEDLRKKAEVTDREPSARSVDPLRQRAEEVALDIVSGGFSRRPLPERKAAPEPDLIDLDELKQRSRDLMLQVLSGGRAE